MTPVATIPALAQRLAEWHPEQQRALPWRTEPAGRRNPYAVWISEIMAQQTRIAVVEGYFRRWMERFPTVHHLAAADQQEVLKLWEGLGYYSRARNLHRAAQIVVQEHGGQLPRDRGALLRLPGIGPYTAGAILSLAFGEAAPVLDGNVKRLLSRLWNVDTPIDERATEKRLWSLAEEIVQAAPPGAAGVVNEGLIELGALICTPQSPRCLLCPVEDLCQAAAHGTQTRRPVRTPRKSTPHYHVTAAVIWEGERHRSRVLIAQRPEDGLLGGLWEFPGGKREPEDPDLPACLRREIREELGVAIAVDAPVVTVAHAYTHFRITLHAFHARILEGAPQALGVADWRWVRLEELDAYPFPVTDQKIIAALGEAAPNDA